jgi:hypothetical protein
VGPNPALLLHTDGVNAGTTFTDSSLNNFAFTASNGATTSTAQKQFGTASLLGTFATSNSAGFVANANQSALNIGTKNFTLDFWWRPTSGSNYQSPADFNYTTGILIQASNAAVPVLQIYNNGAVQITASVATSLNTWHYIKLYRQGTTLALMQDGVLVGTGPSNSIDISSATAKWGFGAYAGVGDTLGNYGVSGNMDEIRLLIGTADVSTNVPNMPWCNPVVAASGACTLVGGTTTTRPSDGKNVYTFLDGGSINCPTNRSLDYLIVAGAGAGGVCHGGGGGAGGLLAGTNNTITASTPYAVTVGVGGLAVGAGSSTCSSIAPRNGGNSSFGGVTAVGGGGGFNGGGTSGSGGSGGGASYTYTPGSGTAGQGNNGGASSANGAMDGGGGGCGSVGGTYSGTVAGSGGTGCSNSITGLPTTYAAGGGGGAGVNLQAGVTGGAGGAFCASAGTAGVAGTNALLNSGCGSGGVGVTTGVTWGAGGNGGSGIVVLADSSAAYVPPMPPAPLIGSSVGSSASTTVTVPLTSAILSGYLVVVGVSAITPSAITATGVSDPVNGAYTKAIAQQSADTFVEQSIWYKENASGVASGQNLTVTFNVAPGQIGAIYASQYPNGLTSGSLDKTAGTPVTSSPCVTSTGTLSQANEIIFGGNAISTGSLPYLGAPTWSNVGNGNASSWVAALDFQRVGSTATVSYAPTWSVGSGQNRGACAVASFRTQ